MDDPYASFSTVVTTKDNGGDDPYAAFSTPVEEAEKDSQPALMADAVRSANIDANAPQTELERQNEVADAMLPKPTLPKNAVVNESRFGDSLKPYFGGHNPVAEVTDDFIKPVIADHLRPDDRSLATRAKDQVNFAAEIPVRAVTQGEYGLSDIGLPGAGASAESFAEHNPGLLEAAGRAGELSMGMNGINTVGSAVGMREAPVVRAAPQARAAEAAADLKAFKDLEVRPFGPAFSQGPVAATAKQLTEVPVVGAPARNALEQSLSGAATAGEEIAGRLGPQMSREAAGNVAKEGMARFKDARPQDIVDREVSGYSPEQISEIIKAPVRNTSLKTKQAALYERAWSYIPDEIKDDGQVLPMKSGRAVKDLPRVTGDMPATREVLNQLTDRNLKMINRQRAERLGVKDETGELLPTRQQAIPKVALPVKGGLAGAFVEDVLAGNWKGSLQTMRNVRSDFRRLASGIPDTERNTLNISDYDRIYSAISKDMASLLDRNAAAYQKMGDTAKATATKKAADEFRRADKFTAMSARRIEHVEKMFDATDAKSLYSSIEQSAQTKSRSDSSKLRTLTRTLREPEMDQIRSSLLREMWTPVDSARGISQELGFSVQSFITRWSKMSDEAKDILFTGEHRAAIDKLVRIANRLANVEALTNTSRTLSNSLGIGAMSAGGGAYVTGTLPYLLGSLASSYLGSVIFSRPAYAKWAVKYAELREMSLKAPVAGKQLMESHLQKLYRMARTNPELIPVAGAVAADINGQPPVPSSPLQ